MASCNNRELRGVTYSSANDPLSQEVVWSLGAGCRNLVSLEVAPLQPCELGEQFNSRVVQMITWCWPNLKGLSIGGKYVSNKSLISIAINCKRLQILELSHMAEISEDTVREMTRNGMKHLHVLMLTHTRASIKALILLLKLCKTRNLKQIRMKLSPRDFTNVENSSDTTTSDDYDKNIEMLQRLQKRYTYSENFELVCEF